ncbi:MAG TPA: hypothetical protein VKV21_18330 [Solirubrobacteraceae bacterium]|nr:hypothetical protein [Solirubrobacteraceae bacterium]
MSTHRSTLARVARIAVSLLVIGGVIAAAALARTSGARRLAERIGIRTSREPYTALSFVHPASLGYHGVSYRGREVRDRVRFRIADRTHRSERYRWTISFAPQGRTYHGIVSVADGGAATVGRRVLLPCARLTAHRARSKPAPRVQVRVHLEPSGETIDYWQVCGG